MIQSIQCCGSGSGIGKNSKSGSGMNIPYHISESLETIFWVNLKYKNGEYKNSLIQIWILDPWIFSTRDGKKSDPGSGTNVPDPQHWVHLFLLSGFLLNFFPYLQGNESDPNCLSTSSSSSLYSFLKTSEDYSGTNDSQNSSGGEDGLRKGDGQQAELCFRNMSFSWADFPESGTVHKSGKVKGVIQ